MHRILELHDLWQKLFYGTGKIPIDAISGIRESRRVVDVEDGHLTMIAVLDKICKTGCRIDGRRGAEHEDEIASRNEGLYAVEFRDRFAEPDDTWSEKPMAS